ncbi:MAG: restriction endonuclease subunit S, partial [Methylophaga sp.]|nr:restriction endonuclease subunit S [Methylophaga sp.]
MDNEIDRKRQSAMGVFMSAKYQAYDEYKEADLGWLNQIPKHWKIKRLKYLGDALIGLTYSPDEVVDEGEGTLVLRSSNVQNKQLAYDDNVYVNKKVPSKLVTQTGDILLCARNGSRALIGKNAQIDDHAAGMTFGAFMSIFRSPYNDYLSKVFNSPLFESQSGSFLTATINQLTTGNLNSFEIPLPPEVERKNIA